MSYVGADIEAKQELSEAREAYLRISRQSALYATAEAYEQAEQAAWERLEAAEKQAEVTSVALEVRRIEPVEDADDPEFPF